jgi:hypothetical protein
MGLVNMTALSAWAMGKGVLNILHRGDQKEGLGR